MPIARNRLSFPALAVTALLFLPAATGVAADWGSIKGRFVFGGDAPAPVKLTVDKDVEVCGKHNLVNEAVVVGDDMGLANVVVFVRDRKIDVHPDLKAEGEAVLDNLNCRFEPHVVFVQTGQEFVIKNSDPIGHNSNVATIKNPASNSLIPAGGQTKIVFDRDESIPAGVTCNIHPWMKAWVVVRDNPYAAVSAADGSFEIDKLPAKEVELQLWHEKAGYLDSITIDGKKKSVKRGRMDVEVKPDGTDLGDIILDASLFD